MRILVGDEDPYSRRVLVDLLNNWGYEGVPVSDGKEAWLWIQRQEEAFVAILSQRLTTMDGFELCQKIHQRTEGPRVFVFILLEPDRRGELTRTVDSGAEDFLVKPVSPHELRLRLRTAKEILDLQTTLREQATRDPLTRAWNRSTILELLKQEIARAGRQESKTCVIICDVDHIRRINESYGHFAGDTVLCEVHRRMRPVIRVYDSIGRFGGGEFLIIIPGCGTGTGSQQAKRLRKQVTEKPVVTPRREIIATCSYGVAGTDVSGQVDVDTLLRAADMALQRAKEKGGNCVETATAKDVLSLTVRRQ